MKKILLYGIGSYKNRGVEAIVNSTINQMDKKYEITIANLYNSYNSKKYNDKIKKYIPHISTNSKIEDTYTNDKNKLALIQKNLINEIDKNDICISCGGDNYCYKASHWLYTIDEAVKNKNKKLILWGASLYDEITELDLINDMNLFDILYIRESISYDAIKPYVDERKLILGPDPAFSLKPKKIKLNEWYQDRKIIGINLSPFTIKMENEESYNSIVNLINYILKNTDYSINLIPHVTQKESNDMVILEKLKADFKEEERINLVTGNYDCCQIKYIISKCDILIAARTHASIAGYSSCVPTLVIGYSVKSKGIAKDIFGTHNNYVIPFQELNTENIINTFKWFFNNKDNIKKQLDKVIPAMREKSGNVLQEILNKIKENDKKIICDKNKCIGCGLCYKKCPNNAITFEKDNLGFYYSKINLEKCVECNLCKKICPINTTNENSYYEQKESYACKSKNDEIRLKSSSGGIFPIIAEKFITKMNGIVYGATISDNQTKHIRIDKVELIKEIVGSKYTQSSLLDIINQISEDIKNKKKILFSGTPCQVGAIKRLAKNYKNIYYISIVCHGVMNDSIVRKILTEKGYPENTKVYYHCKDYAWDEPSIKLISESKKETLLYKDSDIMNLYINNIISRNSCYDCKFKGINNQADIILGDYWGVLKYHENLYDKKGVSALIVNSLNGKNLLYKLKIMDDLIKEETKYENIVEGNPLIEESVEKTIDRYTILKNMEKNSIKLISENIKNKKEIEHMNQCYKDLENITELFYKQKEELKEELNNLINSKRWKMVDKTTNQINKILRKK